MTYINRKTCPLAQKQAPRISATESYFHFCCFSALRYGNDSINTSLIKLQWSEKYTQQKLGFPQKNFPPSFSFLLMLPLFLIDKILFSRFNNSN